MVQRLTPPSTGNAINRSSTAPRTWGWVMGFERKDNSHRRLRSPTPLAIAPRVTALVAHRARALLAGANAHKRQRPARKVARLRHHGGRFVGADEPDIQAEDGIAIPLGYGAATHHEEDRKSVV